MLFVLLTVVLCVPSPQVGGSISFLKAGVMLYILSCVAQYIDE